MWHLALAAYDRMIGLELSDLAIDGCITKVPCGGEVAGRRWVIERTHAWGNTFGKLRCCTERRRQQVEFYLALACAVIVVRALIGRARLLYRWDARPTARRLR